MMESIPILIHNFSVQDNSKLMDDTRAQLRARRAGRPSPWTWTFGYLGCILILCTLGPFWFVIAVLIMHLLLFLQSKRRIAKLRREAIKTRFSRH